MITVVDYKAGNLTSVSHALRRVGVDHVITDRAEEIAAADRVFFPGVGAAGAAMENLRHLGIGDALREAIGRGTPVLGICIGCQLLLETSEEDGGVACLGVLPGRARRFAFSAGGVKIPHMGWNPVGLPASAHPVFEGIPSETMFYFVHSFYPDPSRVSDVLARTEYGGLEFASAIGRDNVVATQFHAEKSGEHGLRILSNFARWRP